MTLPISSIGGIASAVAPSAAPAPTGKPGEFASLLEGAISGVDQYRAQADQAVQNFLTGQNEELHTVALSVQRAEMAFDLGLQVRNKIVEAYQEVMRMQL